ncbi:hypothetical protein CDL15_Pgr028468 [Punica granatum]|uniref:inorganic diphosphatase n=2 Tax=Punica granatum TaxID=22663 RepID=A0A218VXM8_PUNGR|nr:hypothetical protein CDL15_Pgr028468 [Punica granatum]
MLPCLLSGHRAHRPTKSSWPPQLAKLDVVEIGETRRDIGQILRVKPLAALAMIDEGELDWKIVAISLDDDPKASLVNDVDDVEKHFPIPYPVELRDKLELVGNSEIHPSVTVILYKKKSKACIYFSVMSARYPNSNQGPVPDGKPANEFGLGNKPANKHYALKVITETNESWAKLVKRSIPSGELSLV